FSGLGAAAALKELHRVLKAVLDVEELAEAQQLEHFVDLGLDLQEDDFASLRTNRFQERRERPDTGGRNVVQAGTVENDAGETRVDGLGDPFLEEVRVVGVDVPRQVQDDSIVDAVRPLKTDLEAVVLFVVEAADDVVVCAHYSLNLLAGRIGTMVC